MPEPAKRQWNTVTLDADRVSAMGLFARRQADEGTGAVATSGGRPSPDATVAGRLRVAAVTAASGDRGAEVALTSGLLLGDFPLQLVQLTVSLPHARWPGVDQDLPAIVDPAFAGRFAVTWAVVAVVAGVERTVTAAQWSEPGRPWDSGPDGAHDQMLAAWLVERGFGSEHFGGGRGPTAPALVARLAALGWH